MWSICEMCSHFFSGGRLLEAHHRCAQRNSRRGWEELKLYTYFNNSYSPSSFYLSLAMMMMMSMSMSVEETTKCFNFTFPFCLFPLPHSLHFVSIFFTLKCLFLLLLIKIAKWKLFSHIGEKIMKRCDT